MSSLLGMVEVQFRINKLLHDERAAVTSSPQTLLEIFAITQSMKEQIKTIILTNFSETDSIYFGKTASVTTSNSGGVILPRQKMEIALIDINYSPYFVSSSSVDMGIEIWG